MTPHARTVQPGALLPDQQRVPQRQRTREPVARGAGAGGVELPPCRGATRAYAAGARRGAGAAQAWPRFLERNAGTLTHGLQKRLDLALALAARPRLLLLDSHGGHGTGVIAADGGADPLLAGETAILLIRHDMDAVFQLADRISVLVYGKVVTSRRRHIKGACRGAGRVSGDRGGGMNAPLFVLPRPGGRLWHQPGAVRPRLRHPRRRGGGAARAQTVRASTTIRIDRRRPAPAAQRDRLDGRPIHAERADAIARPAWRSQPEGRRCSPISRGEHLVAFAARRNGVAEPWTRRRGSTRLFLRSARSADHLGNQLSGGEQQMLAIARALSTNPRSTDPRRSHRRPRPGDPRGDLALPRVPRGQTTLVVDKYVERADGARRPQPHPGARAYHRQGSLAELDRWARAVGRERADDLAPGEQRAGCQAMFAASPLWERAEAVNEAAPMYAADPLPRSARSALPHQPRARPPFDLLPMKSEASPATGSPRRGRGRSRWAQRARSGTPWR